LASSPAAAKAGDAPPRGPGSQQILRPDPARPDGHPVRCPAPAAAGTTPTAARCRVAGHRHVPGRATRPLPRPRRGSTRRRRSKSAAVPAVATTEAAAEVAAVVGGGRRARCHRRDRRPGWQHQPRRGPGAAPTWLLRRDGQRGCWRCPNSCTSSCSPRASSQATPTRRLPAHGSFQPLQPELDWEGVICYARLRHPATPKSLKLPAATALRMGAQARPACPGQWARRWPAVVHSGSLARCVRPQLVPAPAHRK
jgi:hypothetical protein